MPKPSPSAVRVTPRPSLALFAWGLYVLVFIGLFLALGVDYDAVGDSSSNALKAVVIPVGGAVTVMIFLVTRWGWWRLVMRDTPVVGHRWMYAIPVFMACAIIGGLIGTDWHRVSGGLFVTLLIGCALVGFGEEICNRGVALVGMRGGVSEAWAWFITCGLFGLLHAFNIVVGQSVGATIRQIFFAFLVGSVFYATRRVTGLLVVCMVLHGLWDFMSFVSTVDSGTAAQNANSGGFAPALFLGLAVICSLVAMRRLVHTDPATGEPAAAPAETPGVAAPVG